MGGANSTAAKSEKELLDWGVNWWQDWKERAKDPRGGSGVSFEASDVVIGDKNEHIHTVKMDAQSKAPGPKTPLVMMHGYGSGIGIYYTSLPQLAERWAGDVFAIDSFGCGLSSRPKWTGGYGSNSNVKEVESHFIDALEQWRVKQDLPKFVLLGHSVGGYLACAYAEKYPERCERLILVSPVGVPNKPDDHEEKRKNAPWYFRLAGSMWENGWSPFNVPGQTTLLDKYFSNRFAEAEWVNKDLLKQYWYQNWNHGSPSVGGYSHSTLLLPGAYARLPLCNRIPALKVPHVTFIYGNKDWMDWRHAKRVKDSLPDIVDCEISHEDTEIVVIEGTHNMMIDNPVGFVDAVVHDQEKRKDGELFGRRTSVHIE